MCVGTINSFVALCRNGPKDADVVVFVDSFAMVFFIRVMSSLCLGKQHQNINLTISLQDQLFNVVLATISSVFSEPRGGHKYIHVLEKLGSV
jgi:hypothetical protein